MNEPTPAQQSPMTRRELRERALERESAPSIDGDETPDRVASRAEEAQAAIGETSADPLKPDQAEQTTGQTSKSGKKDNGRSLFSYIMTGVLIGILALTGLIAALAIVVPAMTGGTALTVMTSSMEPNYPPGTMVVIRPTAPKDIKPGDVLTYQLKSGEPTLVTHRVTQSLLTTDGAHMFIVKGDNNPQADPAPVKEVQIKGTIWYAIPYIGWAAIWLTGDIRAVIIPIVVGGLFIYAIVMVIGGLRDRKRKKVEAVEIASS